MTASCHDVRAFRTVYSGLPNSEQLFHLVALVVAASIAAHSSTDVVVGPRLAVGGERNLQIRPG